MIENRHTYAKLKILRSLFSKRKGRPFNIIVFMTRLEKYKYDQFMANLPRTGFDYAKNNRALLFKEGEDTFYELPSPKIQSFSLRRNKKPITLLYYLEN